MAAPRRFLSFTSALVCAALSANAGAQTPSEQMLAQSLFEEGLSLMGQKRYAEACPKLAESQRLDPGGGTLLNLALCHELEGRLATAFTDLQAALSQARKDNRQDRIEIATAHLTAIADRIPRLTLRVVREEPGIEVFLDGTLVRKPGWNVAISVDPGSHVVDARAPGQPAPFRMTVDLAEREQRVVEVVFPERSLEPAPQTSANGLPPAEPPRPERRNPVHTVAVATGIGGFVVAGIGAIGWAVSALERNDQCNEERRFCTPDGLAAADRERAFGWTALIATGIGTAGLVVAASVPKYLSVNAAPMRDGAALSLGGRF